MSDNSQRPWWADLIPDTRAFVAGGYFALAFYLLYMVGISPSLLGNAAFMTVASLIIGTGGLGVVGSFFFGGTKTGAEVMNRQSQALSGPAAPPPRAPPPPPIDPAA
jgi:hypothetical protein